MESSQSYLEMKNRSEILKKIYPTSLIKIVGTYKNGSKKRVIPLEEIEIFINSNDF